MVTNAQKKARENFLRRYAYGIGRGYSYAKYEGARNPKQGYKRTRQVIAFTVGFFQGKKTAKTRQESVARGLASKARNAASRAKKPSGGRKRR